MCFSKEGGSGLEKGVKRPGQVTKVNINSDKSC